MTSGREITYIERHTHPRSRLRVKNTRISPPHSLASSDGEDYDDNDAGENSENTCDERSRLEEESWTDKENYIEEGFGSKDEGEIEDGESTSKVGPPSQMPPSQLSTEVALVPSIEWWGYLRIQA